MTDDNTSASTALLDVRDLSVAFHQGGQTSVAVEGVSFTLQRGRTLALVGESGSGKSVTALSIVKLLGATSATYPSGEILFEGRNLLEASEDQLRAVRGNKITMVFQEPMTSLNPLRPISRQIGEILELHGLRGAEKVKARIIELLNDVGIPDPETRLDAYPHQLSGGQRQRVMIAMALANRPDLFIADEPTTALDVTVQAEILELLRSLRDKLDSAILIITHDMKTVQPMLVAVADHNFTLSPLNWTGLKQAVQQCLGGFPDPAEIPGDDVCAAVTPSMLRLAMRPGQTAGDALKRILALAGTIKPATVQNTGPRGLARVPGLGAALDWAKGLCVDPHEYREGLLDWQDIDRGALLAGPPGCGKTTFARTLA
jgi:ABC-type dipeptide/oligopeptide/nickel transport system ATPase subunit